MIFNTRSGNFYRYDRYTHQIESIAAPAISKGGRVDVYEEKLQSLSFEPIPNITVLPNISTFIIEITRQCNLRCSYCCYSGKYPRNRVHENKNISASQLPLIFDFIEKHRVKERQLTISFYGGEPLLLCFTNYFLSNEELLQDCEYQKMWTRISLIIACEMAERNLYDSEESKLCTLRPLSISDASAVLRIMGDNDVMKYVDGIEPFKTINDAEDFIRLFERNKQNASSYISGIEHKENGIIGYDYIDEDEKLPIFSLY